MCVKFPVVDCASCANAQNHNFSTILKVFAQVLLSKAHFRAGLAHLEDALPRWDSTALQPVTSCFCKLEPTLTNP